MRQYVAGEHQMNSTQGVSLGFALPLSLLIALSGCAQVDVPGNDDSGKDDPVATEEVDAAHQAVTATTAVLAKSLTYDVKRTTRISISIPINQAVDIRVNARESGTDPFAVLYLPQTTDSNRTGHGRVLAYSDDGSGLNPWVRWTNSTGAAVYATLLVFAYSSSNTGTADISVYGNGQLSTTYLAQTVNGTPMFRDNANPNLGTGLITSQSFRTVAVSGNPDTYLWICDLARMTIAWNDDYSGYLSYAFTSPVNDNLLLALGAHYPSFVLAGGYSTGGQATLQQFDNAQPMGEDLSASEIGEINAVNQGLTNSGQVSTNLASSVQQLADFLAQQLTRG
jgi:hypothetical protein